MACGATLKRSLEFDPLHSPSQTPSKRKRCIPMTLSPSTPPTKAHQLHPSPFSEVVPKLHSDRIAASISAEIRRMHRRKQLHFPGCSSPPQSCSPPPEAMDNTPQCSSSSTQLFGALSPSKKDIPLFTFKQVSMICERMVRDREDQIREDYDKVLTSKIAEQYEAFLKFNHDMIHKKFGDTPMSYVS